MSTDLVLRIQSPGWRYLNPGEVTQQGDGAVYSLGEWKPAVIGLTVHGSEFEQFRRRIPPPPSRLVGDPIKASHIQVGGSHYKDMAIQPFEFITRNGIGYAEGCVIKYVSRWQKKGGVEDLKKARHYLDLLIEANTEKSAEQVDSGTMGGGQ